MLFRFAWRGAPSGKQKVQAAITVTASTRAGHSPRSRASPQIAGGGGSHALAVIVPC